MGIVYFTLGAVALYFFSDWVLDRIERARGRRFKYRDIIFFAIILTLALLSVEFVDRITQTLN